MALQTMLQRLKCSQTISKIQSIAGPHVNGKGSGATDLDELVRKVGLCVQTTREFKDRKTPTGAFRDCMFEAVAHQIRAIVKETKSPEIRRNQVRSLAQFAMSNLSPLLPLFKSWMQLRDCRPLRLHRLRTNCDCKRSACSRPRSESLRSAQK